MYLIFSLMTILLTNYSVECNHELILLHNSDILGRFDEINVDAGYCLSFMQTDHQCIGGLPRIIHAIKTHRELKKTGKNVLYLFGGNLCQGANEYEKFSRDIPSSFVNLLKPDAYAIGANELHQSENDVLHFIKTTPGIPFLSANIGTAIKLPELANAIKKSTIVKIGNMKIGIVGYTSIAQNKLSALNLLDLSQGIQKESESLKKNGCQLIIALGAATLPNEIYLARIVTSLDIIIGGMSQALFYNGKPPSIEDATDSYPKVVKNYQGKSILIVHAYAFSKYLGRLNITLSDKGIESYEGQPIFLSNDLPQDEAALALVRTFQPEELARLHKIVGVSRVILEGGEKCKQKECNLGNMITDAFIHYYANLTSETDKGMSWTRYPIALYSGKLIIHELDLEACCGGNISNYNVSNAIPHSNNLVSFQLRGLHLRHALEAAAGDTYHKQPSLLQVSGLQLTYNLNKSLGNRLVSAHVRCRECFIPHYTELQNELDYQVITNTYVFLRSRVSRYLGVEARLYMITDQGDLDVITSYLTKLNIVYPTIEGRLRILNSGTPEFSAYSFANFVCCLTVFFSICVS